MPKEIVNGVTNFYGPRGRSDSQGGQIGTVGSEKEFVLMFAGDNLTLQSGAIPAGAAIITNAVVEIEEAFVLGGTTPVINVGVLGTEGTNRICQISQANAQALGTYSYASAGTLAVNTPLAAAAAIRVALGGTSPTVTGAGRAKVVVKYRTI